MSVFVIGARNVSKISTAVNTEKFLSVDTDYDESTYAFGEYRNSLYKAYVNISIGCDKKMYLLYRPSNQRR